MKTTLLVLSMSLLLTLLSCNGPEGRKQQTNGPQVWMRKNLDVSTFRNGDPIPYAKTAEEWKAAGDNKQPAWCYYDNDTVNFKKYGGLYNWYAVNDPRGLAPEGYHIPTDEEWRNFIASIKGSGKDSGN